MDEGGRQPVAESNEGFGVFVEGDVAAFVFIEAVEEGAPGGEEAPEAAAICLSIQVWREGRRANLPELVKVDAAVFVNVEHPNHHLNSVGVEACEVAINESFPELPFRQLPCPVLVDRFE